MYSTWLEGTCTITLEQLVRVLSHLQEITILEQEGEIYFIIQLGSSNYNKEFT